MRTTSFAKMAASNQVGHVKVSIIRSAQGMSALRGTWEMLRRPAATTIFQDFHWNLLALTMFAAREEPVVVCARSSHGVAIIPAAIRRSDNTLRLLGEELFDYRTFLHQGDSDALTAACEVLATRQMPLEITAVRECDLGRAHHDLQRVPFSAAPSVLASEISHEQFAARHVRLARNMRRLERLGFQLRRYDGSHSALLRAIYHRKADQDSGSLFHDPVRVEFLVNAAVFHPRTVEVFTLECGSRLGAALVTLRDGLARRFYTGWFDPEFQKHSPALTLFYWVTRLSLADGLDCDYMTGEQPYKLRLATSSMPLYRLCATSQQLRARPPQPEPEIRQVA